MTPEKRFRHRLPPLQRGMLFRTPAAPGTGVSIEQVVLTFGGSIDAQLLRRSWKTVVGRHDILRLHFCCDGDDEPHHHATANETSVEWFQDTLQLASEFDPRAKLDEFLRQDRALDFAMDEGPLMRLALIGGDKLSYCIWTFHRSILDHVSQATVLSEVFAHYDSVPFRVAVEDQALALDYLNQVRETDLRLMAAERASLADVQAWSDDPTAAPLFNTR